MTTEIASAVDSVPLGDLSFVRPSVGDAVAQLAEDGDDAADLVDAVGHGRQVEGAADLVDAARDDVDLGLGGRRQRQHHRVEAAAQRAGQVVDPAVAVVGGGDEVEAADRLHLLPQLRYRQRLLGQDRDQRVLHVGRDAGQLLDAGRHALGHGPHDGAGHEGVAARAVGEQLRVVPAVADGLLRGARRALHEQRRVAADGRGQVLGHPGLGGAGHAEQQQGAVGGEGGDGDLDDAARAHVLGCDHRAVRQRAAEQVGGDGPRRQLPAGRARPVVGGGERGELVGEGVLGVRPQRLAAPCVLAGADWSWLGSTVGSTDTGMAESPSSSARFGSGDHRAPRH